MTFVLRLIFKSQITKMGRMPNMRSAVATKTEKTIVRSVINLTGKQNPSPLLKRCQKYEMGLHWKTIKTKYITEVMITVAIVVRITQICALRLQKRRRKNPMERRMRRDVPT